MKSDKFQELGSPTKMDRFVNWVLAPVALAGGLLLIFYMTLNSVSFSFYPLSVAHYFGGFKVVPSSYLDFPLNILLFLPFGFGLASLLDQARLSKKAIVVIVLLAGILLTWLVESLQYFLPGRTPNISDLLANTLGTLLGLALFRTWQNRRSFKVTILKPRWLALCLLFYLILLAGIGFILRERARLDNWQPRFPLVIGNEKTGDRPWAGNVTDLAFLDKALPADDVEASFSKDRLLAVAGDSLIAYYPLQDAASLADQTGNLWDLYWTDVSGQKPTVESPRLDGRRWLRSEWAVIYLGERILATSQFTTMLTVSTADLQQTGPARIVSISATPYYRNLTLGQEGQDLVVRVRTPLTRLNGTRPELKIPGAFVDREPHKVVVTYDGLALTVYIDDANQSTNFQIVPGLTFFYTLYAPFRETLTAGPATATVYMVLFYLLAFTPVGFILAVLSAQLLSHISRITLLLAGMTLPAIFLELVLTANSGYQLRLPNILLAATVTGLSYLLFTPMARKLAASRKL